ncbi:MAG: ABC transporter ATP-binding protein [Planctomycetota bacterium]|nr:MAG: ABC transporter ATP-binding protein [Planctomycetota bacterium]
MQRIKMSDEPLHSEENIVDIVGVSKIFKDFWGRPKVKAVQDISLTIKKGEIFGLLGPNGSGKSTTIKMMLGLLNTSKGKIAIFGQSPRSADNKKRIGFLPEESYLYSFLTAEETLNFFGGLYGLSKAERKRRTEELIKMVGLDVAKKRRVGEYSKGMARRIGLAQCLIGDPELIILDEPTTGLDPIGVREIKDLILNLKSRGKTILLSSHLLSDVQDICDRVCILYGGKITSMGSLDELLTKKETITFELSDVNKEMHSEIIDWLKNKGISFKESNAVEGLEEYFLRIINEWNKEYTDGASQGSAAPEFLNSGGESAVISELVKENAKAIPEEVKEEVKPEEHVIKEMIKNNSVNDTTEKKKSSVDMDLIDQLTSKKDKNQE